MSIQTNSYLLADPVLRKKEEARLFEQATLLFGLEMKQILRDLPKDDQLTIIDLGAGNGTYLSCFENHFKRAELIAVDKNEYLIEQGKIRHPNIHFIKKDVLEFVSNDVLNKPRIIFVLRFVLQHMNPKYIETLITDLRNNFGGHKLIVIDVNDKKFEDGGNSLIKKMHDDLVFKQHQNGGNRYVTEVIDKLLGKLEMNVVKVEDIFYSTNNIEISMFNNIFLELLFMNSKEEIAHDHLARLELTRNVAFYSRVQVIDL
ncbi:MAG: class I SAM-dependent methyltransferase [Bacteriovoracaceae bacterium]|nr:class I SAM-dependent methyltransferase [Bacteriovoracaceae bacterium]